MCKRLIYRISFVFLLTLIGGISPSAFGDMLINLSVRDLPYGVITTWSNQGSMDDFTAMGDNPIIVEDVDGRKAVTFDGDNWFDGPLSIPALELGPRTVELWAYNPEFTAAMETMVSWGRRGGPEGTYFSFNYCSHETWGAAAHWGGDQADMAWAGNHSPAPEASMWWHLAYTYDGTAARLYVNGELSGERTGLTLSAHPSHVIRIAAQPNDSGDRDTRFNFSGSLADIHVYNRVLTEAEIRDAMAGVPTGSAYSPNPENNATDVLRDVVLSWQPGEFAHTHNVFIGSAFDDVNDASVDNSMGVVLGQDLSNNVFDPGRLEFDQTYYWRVDEVNAPPDATVYKGRVWSFTVEPYAIEVSPTRASASSFVNNMEPTKTIDGSGLNDMDQHGVVETDMWLTSSTDTERWIQYEFAQPQRFHRMWVWNSNQSLEYLLGYGARQVAAETSMDGTHWTAVADVPEFSQAPGTPGYVHNTEVLLGDVVARYVRLTVNSTWGTLLPQAGLSEIRFFAVPVYARQPQPTVGAVDQPIDVDLSWRAGREVDVHNIYLGTDPQALTLVADRTSATTITISADLDQIHYWRVDEVNNAADPGIWEGTVWDFTTALYNVVDDMESYDIRDNKPWKTWDDGFEDNNNGSQVGENPLLQLFGPETNIIHSDRQSLPIWFDNSTAPLSEATRTFTTPQDWNRSGIQHLVLYFIRGVNNTGTGRLYVKINDAQVYYEASMVPPPGWDFWTQWNIDLSTVPTDLTDVKTLTIGIEGAGAEGVIYVDDIRVYKETPEPAHTVVTWWEAETGIITAPMEIFSDDPTASAGQHIGVLEGMGNSNVQPTDGVASYMFTVPADGVYRLVFRVSIASNDNDSFWVRIPGMVTNTTNHTSGWIRFSNITQGNAWHWDEVHSNSDNDRIVEFTLSAGSHALEIARREDGALLDAIALIQ